MLLAHYLDAGEGGNQHSMQGHALKPGMGATGSAYVILEYSEAGTCMNNYKKKPSAIL